MLKRLKLIVLSGHFEVLELVTSIAAIGWGIYLSWPTAHVCSICSYTHLANYGSELVLGIAAFIIGLYALASLAEGEYSHRRIGSAMLTVTWIFLTLSILAVNPSDPSAFLYGLMGVSNAMVFVRLRFRSKETLEDG
jgi:hypothetical protein